MKEKYVIITDSHEMSIEPIKGLLIERALAGDNIINLMDSDLVQTTRFFYLLNKYYNQTKKILSSAGNHEEGISKSAYEIISKLTGRDFNIWNANWLETFFSDNALPAADYVKAINRSIDSGLQIEKPTFAFKITDVPNFQFLDLFKQMIKDDAFYFIDDLVRKAEKDYANKEFPTLSMGGRKIMALHGAPIKFDDWPIGFNPSLWEGITIQSRLNPLRTAQKGLNESKILAIFDYLKKENYLGLIRGHDHEPALIILSNNIVEYEDEPALVLRIYDRSGHKYHYITKESIESETADTVPVWKRDLPRIFDKQFIFCPGPYKLGFYGTATASERRGIKFRIHHINQESAPHTKYQFKLSEKPETLQREDLLRIYFNKKMQNL